MDLETMRAHRAQLVDLLAETESSAVTQDFFGIAEAFGVDVPRSRAAALRWALQLADAAIAAAGAPAQAPAPVSEAAQLASLGWKGGV